MRIVFGHPSHARFGPDSGPHRIIKEQDYLGTPEPILPLDDDPWGFHVV